KEEVKSRSTLGPISPIDDLYTPLYHPEFRQNWQPSLSRNLLTYWISLVRNVGLSLVVLLLFAESLTRTLAHGHGLVDYFGTPRNGFVKIAAVLFVTSAFWWLGNHQRCVGLTQGYLDGYSDCYREWLKEQRGR